MRKALLILIVLALAIPASAQVSTYGVAGAGSLTQKGHPPCLAAFMGGNISLHRDTVSGFAAFTRTGFFYADRTNPDVIGAMEILMVQRTFTVGKFQWFAAVGGGGMYDAKSEQDNLNGAINFELGATIYKSLSLGFGMNYVPVKDDYDEIFLYGMIDLFP